MRTPSFFPLVLLFPTIYCQGPSTSSKRGLVFINSSTPADYSIWDSSTSDLTWYYNYGPSPSATYANSAKLQFVPMLFGAPSSTSDNTFLNAVTQQISDGANVSYVLAFNEPDGTSATGGSNVDPTLAAQTWIREIEPLKKMGVKLGAPAVTGAPTGFTWLQSFFTACNGSCSADFIPVHWYGDFPSFASHLGQVRGTYQNMSIWVTEFADSGADLADSETSYNQSSSYLDRLDYVIRYSYFGSFRSSVSNIGPNAAMLTQDGKLTSIGSLYLGGYETKNVPKGSAGRTAAFAGSSLLVILVAFWCLA